MHFSLTNHQNKLIYVLERNSNKKTTINLKKWKKGPGTVVMAVFTIRLNKYFLDTFIEVVDD